MQGSRGLGVEEMIGMLVIVSSILPCALSLCFQRKNRRKFPVITENFGTLGSKFPDNLR